MSDWKKRIEESYEKAKDRLQTKREEEAYFEKKKRGFVSSIVKPAFDLITKEYPNKGLVFHIDTINDNPCLYLGSQRNYEWKFCLSFKYDKKGIYVSHSLNFPGLKYSKENQFLEPHIDDIKLESILEALALSLDDALNPPSGIFV